MTHRRHCYLLCVYLGLCASLLSLGIATALGAQRNIKAGDTDIGVDVHPAKGDLLFIWQPHEVGLQPIDQHLAQQLTAQGIETWLLDMLQDYFLPNTANNMDRVPAQAFAAVIQTASQTGKHIIVASSGRGAIPLLRGVRQWQLGHPTSTALVGTVLLSPKLFIETPDPGLTGKLMPIATATNQTIVLMQPDQSPWYWKLDQTLSGLHKGGSEVWR